MKSIPHGCLAAVICAWAAAAFAAAPPADWPTHRGHSQHTGFVPGDLKPPWRLVWAREFVGERLGTALEPIVAEGRVFVATHRGNVYALSVGDGRPLWRFQTHDACLHSPAHAQGLVVVGSTDGHLYALEAATGRLRWRCPVGHGGVSAAPVVDAGRIFIGTRAGDFLAVALDSGRVLWRRSLGVPVRQTAAVAGRRVVVTAEDLRVHALQADDGKTLWVSEPLAGQTARDYFPVVVEAGGRPRVIVRTNPILGMGQQIGRDRSMLCRQAGVDDSAWQKLDAWLKSPAARGQPDAWEREQQAIQQYLQEHRLARTFFVLDAESGREHPPPPVLWAAGCQAVGIMPALTESGRLLVFYRSAYGNWNLGVAPLVALGLLDLEQNRITPLEHRHGRQPPWNTFWGTADESQNFTIVGGTAFLVHQGTLSTLELAAGQLARVWGERDTYGGLRSPPWARNEWHGPGRGGVAVAGRRVFWLTGSRLLCLVAGESGPPTQPAAVETDAVPSVTAPSPTALPTAEIQRRLEAGVAEFLSRRWAPLYVQPGLHGADFSFDHTGEAFEALAWCFPHLSRPLQEQARAWLQKEWDARPPFSAAARLDLREGARREWFWTPPEVWVRAGADRPPHPLGQVYAVRLYAERCHAWPQVLPAWPRIKQTYEDFVRADWRLNAAQGDLYANRYLASLLALGDIAARAGDAETAARARAQAEETANALAAWWTRAAQTGTLTQFQGSAELDPFIGKGDGLSFRVAPHRHKVALLRHLTPEVGRLMRQKAPAAVEQVWRVFDSLYATWHLTGEERQVHDGENFVDPPDLALAGFQALMWLRQAAPEERRRKVDLPFCRADLYYLTKLAWCLEPAAP